MNASDRLKKAAGIFEERGKVYGDNYKQFGKVMKALFPTGAVVNDVETWNRLGLLTQIVSKLTRYSENFTKKGHEDSLDDLAVYAAMLNSYDDECYHSDAAKESEPPFPGTISWIKEK